ncbi:MAG TPA: tricarballylate utilization 4Fe-4S protein TcuB [Bryobacteraceae bacterium]|nr:tricarballylate utilization 4Fe-4S protein TcuB [Bryobacteraceae bacterium]
MPVEVTRDPAREGARILTICNACRYCEGYCAVFPALERRMNFTPADLDYLANLCHNCAECYYACQYAPPHEFAVNVPKTLAQMRVRSYQHHAWPGPLAAVFRRKGWIAPLALVIALAIWIAATNGSTGTGAHFYQVISHRTMVAVFGGVSIFILIALAVGFVRFWRESNASSGSLANFVALKQALNDVFRLTYLHGDGQGCTYPQESRSLARWWFHHLTFYGFLLCFAATSVAAIYHYAFGWRAPYGYLSLPVVLGTLGGVGLLAGPAGLFRLKQRGDVATCDHEQDGMDIAFLALLFSTSATGLLLLALRETSVMPLLLAVHLATVLALFVTLPYGKFVHGIYRLAALMRYALERLQVKGRNAPGR